MLRMIIEPNATQHSDIKKLNITVAKLEEATTDALSSFFNDNDKNNNGKKKPYLREIFKVAKAEEQYRRGEIGKTHPQVRRAPETNFCRCAHENLCHGRRQDPGQLPVR